MTRNLHDRNRDAIERTRQQLERDAEPRHAGMAMGNPVQPASAAGIMLPHYLWEDQTFVVPTSAGDLVIIEAVGAGGQGGQWIDGVCGGGGGGAAGIQLHCTGSALRGRSLLVTIGVPVAASAGRVNTVVRDSVSTSVLSITAVSGGGTNSSAPGVGGPAFQPGGGNGIGGNSVLTVRGIEGTPGQAGGAMWPGYGGDSFLGLNTAIFTTGHPGAYKCGGRGGRGASSSGASPELGWHGLVVIYY